MSKHIDGIHLDDEENELLALLRSVPAGRCLDEIEITDRLSWWVSDLFRVSASLIIKGVPVCFSSWTGWNDPAMSDVRETFWYAENQRDLARMSEMIRLEVDGLQKMLQGLDIASQDLRS